MRERFGHPVQRQLALKAESRVLYIWMTEPDWTVMCNFMITRKHIRTSQERLQILTISRQNENSWSLSRTKKFWVQEKAIEIFAAMTLKATSWLGSPNLYPASAISFPPSAASSSPLGDSSMLYHPVNLFSKFH